MTDFTQAFQNDQNNIYRCSERDRSAGYSQVIPSHSTKSHEFVDAHGGIYSVNVFPS